MSQNITIAGASYTGVPRIDVPKTGGGVASFEDASSAKTALTTWLTDNGVTVPSGATLDALVGLLDGVEAGGGGGSQPAPVSGECIKFLDYDGTLVEAWSLSELQSKTALPANPTHTGLVAQGWNRTLAQLKAANRAMNVGQMYVTDDGFTRLYIWLPSEDDLTATVRFTCSVSGGTTIDWGDGATTTSSGTSNSTYSHTYAVTGYYTIKLRNTNGKLTFTGTMSSYSAMGAFSSYDKSNPNKLQKAEFGENVAIVNSAFCYCYSLSSITIPEGVTSIGSSAFYGCSSLSSITIPESVTSIGSSAFYYCYSLSSITIPEGVTSIGSSAFYGCGGVKAFHFKRNTPPTLSNTNAFTSTSASSIFYIPVGSLSAYQTATNWSAYASRMQEEPA